MSSPVFKPFLLPNGAKLKNRIVKAAMEENMADVTRHNQPSDALITLYRTWANGGSSLVLSGHIMVDPRAMGSPGDVLLAEDAPGHSDEQWRTWAEAAKSNNTQFWLQINHPGRQVKKGSGLPTYGPSPVAIDIGKLSSMFEVPREMSEVQILEVIRRFQWTAKKAEELGIDGVEIHAAHGYLIHQNIGDVHEYSQYREGESDVARCVASLSCRLGVCPRDEADGFVQEVDWRVAGKVREEGVRTYAPFKSSFR